MVAVLLNQPQPRAASAAQTLRAAGREVIELPGHLLTADAGGQRQLQQQDLTGYGRIVFVSPSSVMFAEQALDGRVRVDQLACIGQGTATVLAASALTNNNNADERIVRPRQPPFDAAALMRLASMQPGQVERMLIVAGANARTDWIEAARARGIQCDMIAVYRSKPIEPPAYARTRLVALASGKLTALLVVGSVGEFNQLVRWLELPDENQTPGVDVLQWLRAQPALAPHGRIAAHMVQAGWAAVQTTRAGQTLLDAALELSD